ncbi:MAG: ATP-binding protein, partial [Nitrosopumilus sp.]|nr:ATP-binding protein [Nitrosopumilus sp.]
VAVPGSLLIIEEPEAHLHIANLAVMAKYIVKMVRAGLNILVTTHSSILVDVIGMYMQSSKADSKTRRRLKFAPDEYLEFGGVSPYSFQKSTGSGYDIKRIRKDVEEGIPQVGYVSTLTQLYDRRMKLESTLDGP